MSRVEADAIIATTGTNTALQLQGKGTGKVALGDAALLVPDVDGAAGQIATTDGSANLTFAATPGTSGNVLTSNGSAWTSAAAAIPSGGAWTLIGSQTASTSASLDITGIDTTYDVYAFSCTNLTVSSAGAPVVLRCGDSSGFDSGASDYGYHCSKVTDASTSYGAQTHAARAHIHMALSINTTTGDHAVVNGYFAGGMDGVGMFYAHGSSVLDATSADFTGGHWHGARNGVITVDRVQILMETGNIVTGRFTVWGLKHT